MNATISMPVSAVPPALQLAADEFPRALALLLIPTSLLYSAIYTHLQARYTAHVWLTFTSIACYLACPWLTPVQCGFFHSLQNFAIAIGCMKALDMWARGDNFPQYSASGPRPSDWVISILFLTELRYESFTPNHIRVAREHESFSEPIQLAIHTGAFAVLQAMPQKYPTVIAFEVLLAIYIIWTSIQMVLRYKTSPSMFGPLYLAHSLSGFWSETWHNAFASPCESLAYRPLRYNLPRLGVPVKAARSAGILGAFILMAVFHVYALEPILPRRSLIRIGIFFLLNGVATVCEGAVWGRNQHWLKTAMAWIFEIALATWTAETSRIPTGLRNIAWKDLCEPVAS